MFTLSIINHISLINLIEIDFEVTSYPISSQFRSHNYIVISNNLNGHTKTHNALITVGSLSDHLCSCVCSGVSGCTVFTLNRTRVRVCHVFWSVLRCGWNLFKLSARKGKKDRRRQERTGEGSACQRGIVPIL